MLRASVPSAFPFDVSKGLRSLELRPLLHKFFFTVFFSPIVFSLILFSIDRETPLASPSAETNLWPAWFPPLLPLPGKRLTPLR